jgi:exodeoxyribonuclease VII large subunit
MKGRGNDYSFVNSGRVASVYMCPLTGRVKASILAPGMDQLPLFDPRLTWTVTDLTRRLRRLLETQADLQDIWVQGEISNLSRPASGHLYFTLKDAGASLRCVMWRGEAALLKTVLQDGMAVEAHGDIRLYEAGGQYQLSVDLVRPLGEGALYREFLRLKAALEAEGLFHPSRRRPLPDRPQRIGVVTSASGAALRDVLDTLGRRAPWVEVILAASPVQGEEAPPALVSALQALNRLARPDAVLLVRGGGSLEDLWAFNDERVVRAVAASQAPVVTGIGHETDFTLADFAADLRAPTPTAAAELATPLTGADLRAELASRSRYLVELARSDLDKRRESVASRGLQLGYSSPLQRIQSGRQMLDGLARRLGLGLAHQLNLTKSRLRGIRERLASLDPSAVLARGFAVVTRRRDGRVVTRRGQVTAGDELRLRVSDGEFGARVEPESS